MVLYFLQSAAIVAVAIYLYRWRMEARSRNAQSWNSLLAQLRPDWSPRELSKKFLWEEGVNATPEDAWQRMHGAQGLWVIYQNARVLLLMVNFAERNCKNPDRLLLETLRSDAIQIRVCVLVALTRYAFSHTSEGVRINAYRAASMYTGMAARMTQLLQENAAFILPDFVAAM